MDKVSKLIRSALNNSSASEAAQALKMAAGVMQREGINPSQVLQAIGGEGDELLRLKGMVARLTAENEKLRTQESGNHNYPQELREAKEIAIKWNRRAEQLELENREIAKAALASHQRFEENQVHHKKRIKNLYWSAFIIGALVCIVTYNSGKSTGMQAASGLGPNLIATPSSGGVDPVDVITSTPRQAASQATIASTPTPAPVVSKPAPQKAVCYANYGTTAQLRFTYNQRVIKAWVRPNQKGSKWEDITKKFGKGMSDVPKVYNGDAFVRDMKAEAKKENITLSCKTGTVR
ncbi:hypothetical protein TUM12370_11840 [Salmonella enterica subsp. enterica serovar Choleraesuis]|nr:hypothetical protein TUM12370_11840 [Salmonella enterica subsp. enterica serovar Choleraesuis]